MRMVSSPGKSIRRRREICPGLHALAHRRCCRRPCRRPFQATAGPPTAARHGGAPAPDRRSCTYVRRAAVVASLALFGRRAARSACHCAVLARYSSPPLRVAALRRNSREIVDAARPSRRAISRMPWPCARHSPISSRSANTRYRSDGGFADGASVVGGMPPASRNQRAPTAGDTPASIAAASLARPAAIAAQNRRRFSRCATPGRPGDPGNTARSARSERRLPALIATPSVKVLRRPLESTLYTRNAGQRRLFWQGPSLGFDIGGDGARTMMLVYNLPTVEALYTRFMGLNGAAYLVGGFGLTAAAKDEMVVVPIRSGLGARLGVNVGYLKFTPEPTWNPF